MNIQRIVISFLLAIFLLPLKLDAGQWLFVSLLEEQKIVRFSRDKSGHLTRLGVTACPAEPAFMSVDRNARILFVSFRSTGELASYRIEKDGDLTHLNTVDGGADPAYIMADRTNRYLISAYYVAAKVTVHALMADGKIGKLLQTVPTAEKAHGVAIDRNNARVYIPHTGPNKTYQFSFNAKTGRLAPLEPPTVVANEGDHPRHMMLHPRGPWAYTSNEAGDGIGVYAIGKQGRLRLVQTETSLPDSFDGSKNATARCELTPDGRFAYVANRGHQSLAAYQIDAKTGRVKALGQTPTEAVPRSFSITPDGKFLYAAGQASGKIAGFRIGDDGSLERFTTVPSGPISWWAIAVDTE